MQGLVLASTVWCKSSEAGFHFNNNNNNNNNNSNNNNNNSLLIRGKLTCGYDQMRLTK